MRPLRKDAVMVRLVKCVRRFARDERGVAMVLFALMAVVLVALAGGALDYARAIEHRDRAQAAVDAAVLRLISKQSLSADDAKALAEKFVDLNYSSSQRKTDGVTLKQIDVNRTDNNQTVEISLTGTSRNLFLGVINLPTFPIHVTAVGIGASPTNIEVALVFDNSGSMSCKPDESESSDCEQNRRPLAQRRITILKKAAKSFIDRTMVTGANVKVAVVPFDSTVNVGKSTTLKWLDKAGKSPQQREDIDLAEGKSLFDLFTQLKATWAGCIRARDDGFDQWDDPPGKVRMTDDKPPKKITAQSWVPMFTPDDVRGYLLYSHDSRDPDNYRGYWDKTHGGPNYGCTTPPLEPLTSDKAKVESTLNKMKAIHSGNLTSGTAIPLGLAWGWRVLSPSPPFTEGAAYEAVSKHIILLTDGLNKAGGVGYGAYGSETRAGFPDPDKLDARTKTLCDRIKLKGIRIHAIGFGKDVPDDDKIVRACVTSEADDYYTTTTATGLESLFAAIAGKIGKQRLTR